MDEKFTSQDSLKLINEMIAQSRNNFRLGIGKHFIFWGYVITILALANFVLLNVLPNPYYSYNVWILTLFIYIGNVIYDKKQETSRLVRTHIDTIIANIWTGFFFSNLVIVPSVYAVAIGFKVSIVFVLITPIILTLTGLALFITAKASRFKQFQTGAFLFWGGAWVSVASLFTGRGDIQFLVLALTMIIGFIIPGHAANRKAKKENV